MAPRKLASEMTPDELEQQREKWRLEKQAEREEERKNAYVPSLDEYRDSFDQEYPQHSEQLNQYAKEFAAKVNEELGRSNGPIGNEDYVLDFVARCSLGLKKQWVKQVLSPEGEIVAGTYYADSSGQIVEFANRYHLKQSETFRVAYFEFLELVNKRYGKEKTKDAPVIRAELAQLGKSP